jgi:hypothetical protein
MSIYRVKKERDYVSIQKVALNDKSLSWKAKGIHTYMLSLPDDWTFHIDEIATHAKDGVDSLRAGLKELKEKGYLQRYPVKENGKIVRWETHVFETPQIPEQEKPLMEKPHMENPEVGKPQMESPHKANPMLLNNDLELSNELTKKDRLIDSEIDGRTQEQLPSKPEPKGNGMPITDSDAVQSEILPKDWFDQVEQHYLMRRGGLCLAGKDSQIITEVLTEGIPVETIIAGIDRAFDTYEAKYPTDRIRAFSYCATVIRQMHYEKAEREKALRNVEQFVPGEIKSINKAPFGRRGYKNQRKDEIPPLILEQLERQKKLAAGETTQSTSQITDEETERKRQRVQQMLAAMGEKK